MINEERLILSPPQMALDRVRTLILSQLQDVMH